MRASQDDLDFALKMADLADEVTMAAFTGSALHHETKLDGSPVTETDRQVEQALRDLVAESRPGDGFLGEETGVVQGQHRRWIVDPIDGTQSFIAGGEAWGTLVALEDHQRVLVGVASAPVVGCRWWGADGIGAFGRTATDGPPRNLIATQTSTLDQATWSCNPPIEALSGARRSLAERLCAYGRYVEPEQWTTHPVLMVAEGTMDICLALEGEPWDYAALVAILHAANGKFSYLDSSSELGEAGPAIFSNHLLHDLVLEVLADGTP